MTTRYFAHGDAVPDVNGNLVSYAAFQQLLAEVVRLQEILNMHPRRDGKPLVPGQDPGDGTAERLGVAFKFRAEE